MESVARRAGVSTKTLYRLIPTKSALFEGMVSVRLDRFAAEVRLHVADHGDIEEALCAALMVCADLAIDEEVIALRRIVLQQAGKRSDIAGTFYEKAIQRTVAALADWLRLQKQRGLIALDEADEAAGMLLGMLTSAPRRDVRRPAASVAPGDRNVGAKVRGAVPAGVPGNEVECDRALDR